MICISLQNKTCAQILEILSDPSVEMAEIRLDRCPLSEEEIEELFSQSDTPLIATCRLAECGSEQEAERRLRLAIEAARKIIPEDEIYLRVRKDNIASQKVMLNNGAYIAGEDENHLFMRIP